MFSRSNINQLNFKIMPEKIIEKYRELKAIVGAFIDGDKAEPEKFIEDVKAKVKEFSELLEKPEEEKTD